MQKRTFIQAKNPSNQNAHQRTKMRIKKIQVSDLGLGTYADPILIILILGNKSLF